MTNEKWLIDVNEFRKIFWSKLQDLKFIGPMDVEHIILNTPKVDAVEVVHGRWEKVIPSKSAAKWSIKVSCSVCHKQGYTHHKYCPNCGARMDGGN